MAELFSPQAKYSNWRRLWVALAKGQMAMGLPITEDQIAELEAKIREIDFDRVAEIERETSHDVVAHLRAYAELCPQSSGILHLGATSAYVTDNGDLLAIQAALTLLESKLNTALKTLSQRAKDTASLPTVGYTHFQIAQPTTVGKRICLWLQDLLMDLQELRHRNEQLRFLGVKGATGTQSALLQLFDGDAKKVSELDELVKKAMGFDHLFPISGQTYTRKQDHQVLSALEGLGASLHKMGTDLRLLAHLGEVAEPGPKAQVGSSAMPHKKNPILCERLCALSRHLMSQTASIAHTHATQWLERSLDDSALRRLAIPEAFLLADSILNLLLTLGDGLIFLPEVIQANLEKELPSLALENILMSAVKVGKDRQEVHELLCAHMRASKDSLQDRIAQDAAIGLSKDEIETALHSPYMTGRAQEQVIHFLKEDVAPLLR